MGRIKNGIFGDFSGKVGNAVGCKWKQTAYIRSLPSYDYDAKSTLQLKQRNKFTGTMRLLQPITPYLRIGYLGSAQTCTTYHAAMSYLLLHAWEGEAGEWMLNYNKVLVSRGTLMVANTPTAEVMEHLVRFGWSDNSGQGDARATDWAMPMVYNLTRGEALYSTAAARRAEEMAEIALPAHWQGDEMAIYLAFVNQEGTLTSNSVCLGVG